MKIRCRVLQPLKAETPAGRIDLSPGSTIEVSGELAAPLIEAGKLEPVNTLPSEGASQADFEGRAWCYAVCIPAGKAGMTEAMSKYCERARPCPKYASDNPKL